MIQFVKDVKREIYCQHFYDADFPIFETKFSQVINFRKPNGSPSTNIKTMMNLIINRNI